MNRTRVTAVRLRELAAELPTRYVALLRHLAAARVLTGAHLDELLGEPDTSPATSRRVRRRITARLSEAGLVSMLPRRIGGVRAGSDGHVYTFTHTGRRFLALLDGESDPPRARYLAEPTFPFLAHALAVSDMYVHLVTRSRNGIFRLTRFITEPTCWWPLGNGSSLHPDAYLMLDSPTHTDCWWLEVDQSTETTPRLRTKCRAYLTHATSGGTGPDDVLPRVLFTAPTQQRTEVITAVITSLRRDTGLIVTATHQHAADFLINELHTN